MATELDVWLRARELLAGGWCQGEWAIDVNGDPANPTRNNATYFCTMGAVSAAREELKFTHKVKITVPAVPGRFATVFQWNDHFERTQEEVLAAVDARIAELRRWEML